MNWEAVEALAHFVEEHSCFVEAIAQILMLFYVSQGKMQLCLPNLLLQSFYKIKACKNRKRSRKLDFKLFSCNLHYLLFFLVEDVEDYMVK